jgi:hypothetical protein
VSAGIIDVVVGLAFLYFLLSLVCSGINELIAGVLRLRASNLEVGIGRLLGDEELKRRLFDHPLIRTLGQPGRTPGGPGRKPSYLPASKFTLALLDLVASAATGTGKVDDTVGAQVQRAIDGLPADLRASLTLLWRRAAGNLDEFHAQVEGWFDDAMERVSGWYRRKVRAILIVIGVVVAVALNVNTVTVSSRLWTDAPLRAAVVAQVSKAQLPAASAERSVQEAAKAVQTGIGSVTQLGLPMGWNEQARPAGSALAWLAAVAGWLLTAAALSLGAPFWFDLLNKVTNLRATGAPPRDSGGQRPPPSAPAATGTTT